MTATKTLFVGGRVCLFGEHSDWAAEYGRHRGYCIVVGTDQGLRATASACERFVVASRLPDATGRAGSEDRRISCDWDKATLLDAAQDTDEFFRYCAGVAHEMANRPGVTGGLDLRIESMDLPLKRGVSSSAAVCILVARAFNAVYDLGLLPSELREAAYRGEKLTGSQCGRMDQACIYGKTPVLLTFERGSDVRVEPISPGGTIHAFFVDLAGQKDTVRILSDLQNAYLRDEGIQEALGPVNERIARRAYGLLMEGRAEGLGRLMTEAQQAFDRAIAPHSPEQLASPRLHELLGWEPIQSLVYGGKGVGSQGDGTAQFIARSAADRKTAIERIEQAWPQMQCFPLDIAPAGVAAESES